jgi:hypothetical protein
LKEDLTFLLVLKITSKKAKWFFTRTWNAEKNTIYRTMDTACNVIKMDNIFLRHWSVIEKHAKTGSYSHATKHGMNNATGQVVNHATGQSVNQEIGYEVDHVTGQDVVHATWHEVKLATWQEVNHQQNMGLVMKKGEEVNCTGQ